MKPNAAVIFVVFAVLGCATAVAPKPNLLLVVAGLGYGDAGCYGATKVNTPDIDRLAREGMRCTDPHSPFTACRPSRYRLLAGRMAFRSNCPGISEGVGGPCLINPERLTWSQMRCNSGDTTAVTHKWHVGLSRVARDGRRFDIGEVLNPGQPSRPVASHIQPLIFTGHSAGAEAETGGRKPEVSVRVPA